MIAPGAIHRQAIETIIQAQTGALLCIGDPKKLLELSEGGVKLDEEVTPQMLYELSKMDGAIILNEDGSKILSANRFLKPNAAIPSFQTGTRHRTAERLANQATCIVIAVSQRRSTVSVYVHDTCYVMESIEALLSKAQQAILTAEKYMSVLEQNMYDLTIREFQDVVTIFDVCKAVQRIEMVARICREIEPYVLELGTEGRLIDMQLQELLEPLSIARLVIRDYYKEKAGVTYEQVLEKIAELSEDDLLNLGAISHTLGYGPNLRSVDTYLTSRGYRVLTQTKRLPDLIIENLVQKFSSLQRIVRASKDDLVEVDGIGEVLAERVRVSLNILRNQPPIDDRR